MRERLFIAKIPRREAGLSLISWLFIIALVVVILYAAFRVVPAYIECARLGSILDSIRNDARTKSIPQLRTELANQLVINSSSDIELDDFKFVRDGDRLTISINESLQRSWIGNLGFVVHCRHSITVTRKNDD